MISGKESLFEMLEKVKEMSDKETRRIMDEYWIKKGLDLEIVYEERYKLGDQTLPPQFPKNHLE